eukprot:4008726-Ditylum_brightwellii.AAC.1
MRVMKRNNESAIGRHYINDDADKKWSIQENRIVNSMVVLVEREDDVGDGGGHFILICIFVL